MAAEVVEFLWDRSPSGYQWVEAMSADQYKKEPVLVAGADFELKEVPISRFAPLQGETGLFLAFAETEPSKKGIRGFADRFGLLGLGTDYLHPDSSRALRGESLSMWEREITDMKEGVHLWRLCQEGDRKELARYIRWKDAEGVYYDTDPDAGSLRLPEEFAQADRDSVGPVPRSRLQTIASRNRHEQWLERFKPDDLRLPALVQVQRIVNLRLPGMVAPVLLYEPKTDQMVMQINPRHLLGAMWMQFAEAISGNKNHRRCRQCNRWFEVSIGLTRADREFCTNSCRSAAYRERQDQARKMHRDGKEFEEIAEKVGSDIATVKRWISKIK